MKQYILNTNPSAIGATGHGGLKLFVDDLKQRLHLPFLLKPPPYV